MNHDEVPGISPAVAGSKGVTAVGLLFIASSLIHMNTLVVERQWYFEIYNYLPAGWAFLRYSFSWFQRVVGLVAGIGLLVSNGAARKAIIVICWFTILTVPWKHPYGAVLRHAHYLQHKYGYLLASFGPDVTFPSVVVPITVILCLSDIIFCGAVIFFLTRRPVRQLFSRQ